MQKICKNCQQNFEITNEDLKFYEKVSPEFNGKKYLIPVPQFCPRCREQRRWARRNQAKLYKRKCDFSGEDIISLYSPDKSYKVYAEKYLWSDKFDPMKYGCDYDFSKTFFQQFYELQKYVPRGAMQQDGTNENCEYTTFGGNNKNCYLTYACSYNEDLCHSTFVITTKNSCDCLVVIGSEFCYECVDCSKCYNCKFCKDCNECLDSYFLDDCKGCANCICCKNLRNKSFYIYNKKVSKEEFEKFKKYLDEGDLLKEKEKFDQWKFQFPYICQHIVNSENSDGDYLEHAKNCHQCFDIVLSAEDCKYCQYSGWNGKDMMDVSMCGKNSELVYEMQATVESYNCAFTFFCRDDQNSYYCDNINHCKHCFGCINLRHKEYCILNKQYTKEEYEILVPKIINKMKEDLEFGELFPITLSPFAYNETLAQEYFPLTKEEVLEKGYQWKDEIIEVLKVEKIIPANSLPNSILEIPRPEDVGQADDILNWAIECEITKKPFKIIKPELEFYRKMNLPIPRRHPDQRHKDRMALRNPRKLWKRNCMKCNAEIQTTYSPDRKEIIYCEKCYLGSIY